MHRLAKLAAAGCALVFAAIGDGGPSPAHERGPSYSLMQMNLCLSARRTGYHLRFSAVTLAGEPLRYVRPRATA